MTAKTTSPLSPHDNRDRFRLQASGFRLQASGFMLQASGFKGGVIFHHVTALLRLLSGEQPRNLEDSSHLSSQSRSRSRWFNFTPSQLQQAKAFRHLLRFEAEMAEPTHSFHSPRHSFF
jgi:hypothetical protein